MSQAPGKYIVVEGIDGCGKDTQLPLLEELLSTRGPIVVAREPYDSPTYGQMIADMLYGSNGQPDFAKLPPDEQALLMNAARAEVIRHIRELIVKGVSVLSSRNYWSTLVYQGHGLEISKEGMTLLRQQCKEAVGGFCPDLLLLLDLPVEEAVARQKEKRKDVLELQPMAFHERIRNGYRLEAEAVISSGLFPVEVISASGMDRETVISVIWEAINASLFTTEGQQR